jgi:uncharacterized protein (UPF0332 family)
MPQNEKTDSYWKMAREAIKGAKFAESDFPKIAISEAYYGAFYAAHSLLALRDVYPKSHEGVNNKLGERFCKTNLLSTEDFRILGRLQENREKAVYGPGINYSSEDAHKRIQMAEIFLGAIEKLREKELSQETEADMAEVQSAESKASLVQGLNKSADGSTSVEGRDIGYEEEGYVAAADQVKYESQQARSADNAAKNQAALENIREGVR